VSRATTTATHPAAVAFVAAHDEEDTVASTVKELLALPAIREVVVVADGCTDRTVPEAMGAGARVLVTPRRLGKGGALEGALWRVATSAEVVVFVDADVGETAGEVSALIESVGSGGASLSVGVLPSLEGGGFGMVKRMAAFVIRTLTGVRVRAPLSGQRALTKEALELCRPLAAGFGVETAMTIDAARLGLRIVEVPVTMWHRQTGRSVRGFTHRARQGVDILRAAAPRLLRLR
jgi:glycosyltransferase involved in cell wall biosynthesis